MKLFVALFLATLCLFQTSVIQAQPAPQTQETWRSVRTNNLFVIGNADAEKLRQVAAWLEFFHSSFARLVSRNVLNSSVPTTVVIFRDDASFVPFKPLYQGRPANISGFFQPGDDVNYIAISLDPSERDPYSTAFHEYVHLHLRDNVPNAPVWLNEGLAELYGSLQFSGNDALLGAPLYPYIRLLRNHELLPLATLFSIGTDSPHYNEQDKSGIFYGESWALVHYLMLGDRGRPEQFKRFLQQVSRGENAAKAIENSFGVTIAQLEDDLRAYVRRGDFSAQRIASVDDPQTYSKYMAIQRTSLSESEANYYLGDLLLHIGRDVDAERYFKQAIALDPSFAKLVRSRQTREPVKDDAVAEPVQRSSSPVLGGTSGVVVNDGETVDRSGTLPTVDELLAKYVEAIGGAAAVRAVTSRVIKGTVDVTGKMRGGKFESYAQAPNKLCTVIDTQPMGLSRIGFNGRNGWARTSSGVRALKGAELNSLLREANFYGFVTMKTDYAKITLAGKSKIGYREVFVVDLQTATGAVKRVYFDAQTYLPARVNTVAMLMSTAASVEIYLDDWRAVDGVKYPFSVSQNFPGLSLLFTVSEIKHNVPIDPKLFEP